MRPTGRLHILRVAWPAVAAVFSLFPFSVAPARDAANIPEFTAHLPEPDRATGTAVVVLPGGGLRRLGDDSELIRRFNAAGIAA
ncbi:MAG: hypothetical protein RLZZ200_1619, partial [Pseudomonadota bacterium]